MTRYLDASVDEAFSRGEKESGPQAYFAHVGPWLDVLFVSTLPRDVAHGLGVVPTGYQLILELGGAVRACNITDWTPDLAFLQADTANTRVRLRFVLTREDPIDA